MPIAPPVAVITGDAPPTAVPASALPYRINLDGSTSTFGTTDLSGSAAVGSSITTWNWYLDKPPESTATIQDNNTSTPYFDMDVPGRYQVRLQVTNNLGVQSEGFTVRIVPSVSPYKFYAPASAYYAARAALPVTGLVPPTSSARDDAIDVREVYPVLESLSGRVDGFTGASPREVWVQAYAGPADADGSRFAPFNPTSAAAAEVDGPIAQAIAAVAAADMTLSPSQGVTINIWGGVYDENITIANAKYPYRIVTHGEVWLDTGNGLSFTASSNATKLARQDLLIVSAHEGAYLLIPGASTLSNADSTFNIFLADVIFADITVSGTFAAGPTMFVWGTTSFSDLNVPNLALGWSFDTIFSDDVTIRSMRRVVRGDFRENVTLTHTAFASDADGFYDCSFDDDTTFTAPAGAARFDDISATRFLDAGSVFAGGASNLDFIGRKHLIVAKNTASVVDVAVDTELTADDMVFYVQAGSYLLIDALIGLSVSGSDSFKVELYVEDVTSHSNVLVATQASALTSSKNGTFAHIMACVEMRNVDDVLGAVAHHYKCIQAPAEIDEGAGYATGLDTASGKLRAYAQLTLYGGTCGASSGAIIRRMTVEHVRGS